MAVLVAVSLSSLGYIIRELTRGTPALASGSHPASRPARALLAAAVARSRPAGDYDTVVRRNLFSPTRTETGAGAAAMTFGLAAPKPTLYGVVLRDDAPVAYLEDPATKRVGGYHTGDIIAGSTIGRITADHVVLVRPEGRVEVYLNDPSKPRPAAAQPLPALGPAAPPSDAGSQPGMPPTRQGRLPREG